MTISPLPTRDLLGVYRDPRLASPSNYWRNLCFNGTPHVSTRQEIIFEKIQARRRVAPFVLPANTGKPIFTREGSTADLFKPAYIKMKDPVLPSEQFDRQPGDLFTDMPLTPAQNWDKSVADVLAFHRDAVDRRWEWMAAQASLYGQVTVDYDNGPSVIVDFARAAGQTVVKSSGTYWDVDYDILGDIQTWADIMTVAEFGGIPNRLTIGSAVWAVMRKNKGIIDEMNVQRRGNTQTNIQTGIVLAGSVNDNVRFVGTVGAGIDVYVYSDFYQDASGNQVPYMDTRDAVLTTSDVGGVPAFGAIVDIAALLVPMPVFPKMFPENDPSAMMIMTQSAPLFIPVYPNRTFRARVLA
jgi:hypothetical protein